MAEAKNTKTEPEQTPKPEKRVKIKIPMDSKDKSPVFVSVNGDACTIKRGKWVEVKPHNAIEQREQVEVKIEELAESS